MSKPISHREKASNPETSRAIIENMLTTVTERSSGPNGKFSKAAAAAAAVNDMRCRIEIPNPISLPGKVDELKTAIQNLNFGYDAETSEANTQNMCASNLVEGSSNGQILNTQLSPNISSEARVETGDLVKGLPNEQVSKAAVKARKCRIEIPNPNSQAHKFNVPLQNLETNPSSNEQILKAAVKDGRCRIALPESRLSPETSEATSTSITEGLRNNKYLKTAAAAAVIDKICESGMPNPRERADAIKTAIRKLNFGYDAETVEAITEAMLAGASNFFQNLSGEQNLNAATSSPELPLLTALRENMGAYNAALQNRKSELTPETLEPITKIILAELPVKSKSIDQSTLASVTNLLKDSPSESTVEEVDQFPYAALEQIYLEMAGTSEQNLSDLQLKKRKIAEQRRKMRKVAANDGGRMTLKDWKKENKKLEALVKDLYWYLDNVLAKFQMEGLEALDAHCRISKASSASSFDSDDLVPKERVALQLLVTRLPDENLGRFLENHFSMEEFNNFKLKAVARDKRSRENTLELPSETSDPNGEKDHKMVSKRALMDDIALRIKQWKKEFKPILFPIAAWPAGYPRMYFRNREKELIDSIVLGLSPLYERVQEDALRLFSFSELEDLSYKVDYRINVMIDAQVQLNLFPVETCEEYPLEPTRHWFDCVDWDRLDREKLVKYFIERITKPKIPEMSMFLLQPEILELLTVEEKFAIIHYRLTTHGCSTILQKATLSWIRNLHSKFDSLERRLKREMNEKNNESSSLWFPKSSQQLSRRDEEDRMLLDCLLFMIIRKEYDRSDPLQRAEFNDDFRFVFSNRKLMFDYLGTMQCSYPRLMNPVQMDLFTERFCTPKESFVEKTRDLPYDEAVLQTTMANRLRRKQHEMALNEEEQDPVRRAGRMREESEQLRILEERDEDKVMKRFLRPSPPPVDNFFKRDDFAQLIVYTNDIKLPKRLTEQNGSRIRRKIDPNDPIRVARQQWRNL